MAKKPAPIKDDSGIDWQTKADAAWAKALKQADGDTNAALGIYSRKRRGDDDEPETAAPALPDFNEGKHKSVKREVFGRFVEDRERRVVHDVNNGEGCGIDKITTATFYHFGHEVPDDLSRHDCVEDE